MRVFRWESDMLRPMFLKDYSYGNVGDWSWKGKMEDRDIRSCLGRLDGPLFRCFQWR